MEDPARAWPAWKFGMKRDDLFTTLHDQYNTFSYTLQDPEAFHHDVYEISRDADTVDEFHRMMADRRQMRLRELNESLETLAVEIIANPKLMATEQWTHALQLFRTKSFDSVVRYFASYIPDDYLDHHDTDSTSSSSSYSESDTISTAASCVDDVPSPFADDEFFPNGSVMTSEQPCSIKNNARHEHHLCEPLSPPPSEAAQSEPSVSSPPSVADSNDYSANSPSRSMSFSGSESRHLVSSLMQQRYIEEDYEQTLQFDDCGTANTSVCESVESPSASDEMDEPSLTQRKAGEDFGFDEDEEFPTAQYPDDEFDYLDFAHNPPTHDTPASDTPTPRPDVPFASHMVFRSIVSKKTPLSSIHHRSSSPKSFLANRGAGSPSREVRRSPEESSSKIQKIVQDFTKKRPKSRRRIN